MFGAGQHPQVIIHEGGLPDYQDIIRNSRFCMAPSGHGWGIRLGQYMTLGCVPVIIQVGSSTTGGTPPARLLLITSHCLDCAVLV